MRKKFLLTHERLTNLLSYDPITGMFSWNFGRVGVRAGSIAGSLTRNGYSRIVIDGVSHYAHRIAIFFVTGLMPLSDIEVDHIDGIKTHNSFSNLRLVSHLINQQNMRRAYRRADGVSSQFIGVSWKKDKSKWVANIGLPSGKKKHLGYFENEESAYLAYVAAKREYHEGNTL
jgi:hypothetical protein